MAVIMAVDVVGSSRLVEADEGYALSAIRAALHDLLIASAASHGGRLIKTMGDGALLDFASPVSAVACAASAQKEMATRASRQPPARQVLFRIGINLGDVVTTPDGDLYGDGVNVAARLESAADPGGILISSKVYDELIGKLALPFVDRGELTLKGLSRPVRAWSLSDRKQARPNLPVQSALPLPDKPSIAVLPFASSGPDSEQDYFADGIVDEIITALCRVKSLFVIARNSSFTYKNNPKDVRDVGRELGVRYVLEGSVRRAGARVRIAAQLADTETGQHIWGDRIDGSYEDIFDLQDRVSESIVGAIQPSLRSNEISRAKRKRPDSLVAYDLVMRALPAIWALDESGHGEALELLERASKQDVNYATPKALAAWCYGQRVVYLRSSSPAQDRAKALALATEAARIDSDDPLVLIALGAAYGIAHQIAPALATIEKALRIDVNSAWAWNRSGWLRVFTGQYAEAIDHIKRGLRLSPLDPMSFNSSIGVGAAFLGMTKYDEATVWLQKGLMEQPSATWALRSLAAAYALQGDLERARAACATFQTHYPGANITGTVSVLPNTPDFKARLAEGLRMAGLPD